MRNGCGTRNRQNYFRQFEKPRQCNLERSRLQRLCSLVERIVSSPCLAQWSPWQKRNAVLFAVINDEIGFAIGEAVAILHGDDRNNFASALNVFTGHIGKRNVAD